MTNKHSDRPALIASLLSEYFDDVDPQAKEIATRIILLSSLIEQANQSKLQVKGINRGIIVVLTALRLSGKPYELHHNQLHERILLTSVTIFNICKAMEDLGLLTMSSDPDSATEWIYRLTLDGAEVAEQVLIHVHREEKKMVDVLDKDEKALLNKLLETLTRQFDLS